MEIAASIVIYKTDLNEVLHVIKCFLAHESSVTMHVIDNSPIDNLSHHLSFDDRIKYKHFPNNPGYGTAHNYGIQQSINYGIPYHIVLNTDLSFNKECINDLLKFMELNQNVGLVMPKIIYPDGSLQYLVRNNPTPYLLFARRFFKNSKKAPRENRIYQNMDKDYNQAMYHIPFISGCFMFFRTEVLKQSGLFDEKIFMYTEDADLSRRVLQHSETAYWPKAVAIHNFKGGVHKNLKLTWYGLKSAFYYFNKWGWNNKIKDEIRG
ncbi:MAG TPA: glycosyltransferase family 2 protein [Edaphocola sp.]|nr:glycosyltransferase family 2 protein [Edaphocola sp.]